MLCALLATAALTSAASDRDAILDGVKLVAAPGIPGSVSAFGPEAAVLVAGREGGGMLPVAASARFGRGRIIALGHDGYFGEGTLQVGDTRRFLRNAVRWASGGKAGARVGVVRNPALEASLDALGFQAEPLANGADPAGFDAVVTIHHDLDAAQVRTLQAYLRRGGGLVAASTGWGWQQITGRAFQDHPLNRVLEPAGLVFTGAMLDRTAPDGFDAAAVPPRSAHAGQALDLLADHTSGKAPADDPTVAAAVASVLNAATNLPDSDRVLLPRLERLKAEAKEPPIPSDARPITLQQPVLRIAAALDTAKAMRVPAEQVRPHPAGSEFPGPVPADAPRVTATRTIDTARKGWQSLGLYAAPGERVTVTVPPAAAGKGIAVRIGCHTDGIWHLRDWRRMPEITRSFPVAGERTIAANPFGGLVYLDVPPGANLGTFSATVSGAVESPLFLLGKTTDAEWKRLRNAPGPWAEIGSDKVIVTVPSRVVRQLEDPAAVARFWDEVSDATTDLAMWPRERARAERFVADVQISAGYMHAVYPIMTHLDVVEMVVDVPRLRREGSWGHYHEIGHNHQNDDWTFDGTVEVTVNLFSMYTYAKVNGIPFDQGHPAIRDPKEREARVAKYLAEGARFERWQSDPFLALTMYIDLVEAFGWQPFKDVFAEYLKLPQSERPRTEMDKRSQWMTRMSRRLGKNLGPFFERWGVPTSPESRAALTGLPGWMPPRWAATSQPERS